MSLFSAVADLLKPAPHPEPAVLRGLNKVAELVDPLLRVNRDFEKALAFPVQHALGYCDGLVSQLPGPIEINRHAFVTDPLVHALFATPDDIGQMLGRSQAVRDFLASPYSWEADHFYTMLAARRQQKRQLGMAQQGDVVRTDVPQTVLYFSSHTLIEPSCELETTLRTVREKAFESLLQTFHAHVEALRIEREGLRSDVSCSRAHLSVLRGTSGGAAYEVSTRQLNELDAQLNEKCLSLQPEQLIEALADFLQSPEPALHLTPVSITVDRLGVIKENALDDPSASTLNFPELSTRDMRLHLAMLARVSREEAAEAVEKVRDQQHRFMLI